MYCRLPTVVVPMTGTGIRDYDFWGDGSTHGPLAAIVDVTGSDASGIIPENS